MVGNMSDPVGKVSALMKGRGVMLPKDNEWLNACVQCFTVNTPNYSPQQLFDFVFEQWTLADLADVCAPCLPPECACSTKMMLPGNYAVQINYFLDVGAPLHKQMQKIRRPGATKNLEVDYERLEKDRGATTFNREGPRSLKMEITDGVTKVIGFEDQPIPIGKKPLPGEKAVLCGPIEVRKGVLLLKSSNVTLLRGEVDTLLVRNAEENILARALGQAENPDPYNMTVQSLIPTPNVDQGGVSQVNQLARQSESNQEPSRSSQESNKGLRPQSEQTLLTHTKKSCEKVQAVTYPPPPKAFQGASSNPTSNIFEAFNDGEDETLASLAEAIENDSFNLDDSPISVPQKIKQNNSLLPKSSGNTSNSFSKPSKTSQRPTNQPTILNFLSQSKQPSSPRHHESSPDIDNGFNDDFEMTAAITASLVEQRATVQKTQQPDPDKLKKQLEASYSAGSHIAVSTKSFSCEGIPSAIQTTSDLPVTSQNRQLDKRRRNSTEHDIFGRPKIPRLNSSSPHSKNPRQPQQDEHVPEELHDWIPPPQKANLDHTRPLHEKDKILVDYTNPSALDLDSVPTDIAPSTVSKSLPSMPHEPFPPKEFPCTRKTFGKVVKVINKLQLKDAKWVLSAIVEVKGVEMEMEFSPETLDKIFTVTAEEIAQQKEQLKKNPKLKEKFNQHLRESQKRIQTLACEMSIYFKNFISKPVVLNVSVND